MEYVLMSLALVAAATILVIAIAFQIDRSDFVEDPAGTYFDPSYWA